MGDMKIKVRDLQHDSRTNAAILVFYVEVKIMLNVLLRGILLNMFTFM